MTVRITKPEFNLREKLTELDHNQVPYEKMPAGSVVQVAFNSLYGSAVSTTSASFQDSGLFIDISPRFVSSKIIITASLDAQTGNASANGVVYTVFRRIGGTAAADSTSLNLIDDSAQNNFISYHSQSGYIHERAIVMVEDNPKTIEVVQYRVFFASFGSNSGSAGFNKDWGGIHIKAEEIRQ